MWIIEIKRTQCLEKDVTVEFLKCFRVMCKRNEIPSLLYQGGGRDGHLMIKPKLSPCLETTSWVKWDNLMFSFLGFFMCNSCQPQQTSTQPSVSLGQLHITNKRRLQTSQSPDWKTHNFSDSKSCSKHVHHCLGLSCLLLQIPAKASIRGDSLPPHRQPSFVWCLLLCHQPYSLTAGFFPEEVETHGESHYPAIFCPSHSPTATAAATSVQAPRLYSSSE